MLTTTCIRRSADVIRPASRGRRRTDRARPSGASVHSSSNWSITTTSGAACWAAIERTIAHDAAGVGLFHRGREQRDPQLADRIVAGNHRDDAHPAARSLGTSPAWTSDDLPEPDAPTTATKACSSTSSSRSGDERVAPVEVAGIGLAERAETLVRVGYFVGERARRSTNVSACAAHAARRRVRRWWPRRRAAADCHAASSADMSP